LIINQEVWQIRWPGSKSVGQMRLAPFVILDIEVAALFQRYVAQPAPVLPA
jgi:hypothetical protein